MTKRILLFLTIGLFLLFHSYPIKARQKYRKEMTVIATAYTHTGNPTASGIYPYVGSIAVDPSVIPLGTKLYIENYGHAIALDTGELIKGNKIDLFFDTKEECYQWGIKKVKIYFK
jgi:3D (Asp-Asp-Asp) domain-containing protein